MGLHRRKGCKILYLLALKETELYLVSPFFGVGGLARPPSAVTKEIFWRLIAAYCNAVTVSSPGGSHRREIEVGSEWNKRAVNRLGVRMKNENKRWPTSPGEGEGNTVSEGKMWGERKWKEWETGKGGREGGKERGGKGGSGLVRDSVQKMELEPTVALLYLYGKMRIYCRWIQHMREAQAVTYMCLWTPPACVRVCVCACVYGCGCASEYLYEVTKCSSRRHWVTTDQNLMQSPETVGNIGSASAFHYVDGTNLTFILKHNPEMTTLVPSIFHFL